MADLPSVADFYGNKSVFITGGTGFIGKVLIEKLLRSCPDLKSIYLLMREKKGKSVEERIRGITDLPLFDLLKSQNLEAINKIKILKGDVRELGLGLSPEERKLLVEEVNVVFHVAASVRFDDSLTDAVILNVRGTREVVKLVLEMKNLFVFEHVSTTYCHTDQKVIEERVYPPHADWRKTIEIAENVDRQTLNALTEKFIHPLPNTYTFTKSLAEHVVNDLCTGKVPAVVYRPSVIVSTANEPIPAWIDNFNGPMGLFAGVSKGIIRTVYGNPDINTDYVPVDLTVKAMILSAWKYGINRDVDESLTPEFYNGSNYGILAFTFGDIVDIGKILRDEVPFDNIFWYPNCTVTKYYYIYYFKMILYHFIPAVVIDTILKLSGRKPMLTKLHRRVHVAMMSLAYFTHNGWRFENLKTFNLKYSLQPHEKETWSYKEETLDVVELFKQGTRGLRLYLFNEKNDSLEKAKMHTRRMWILAQVVNFLWYLGIFWFLFFIMDILGIFVDKWNDLVVYFEE